jgi:hypothetical protein
LREYYGFDTISRQQPFNEDELNPADNLKEYGYLSDEELNYYQTEIKN